ncbi:MAG: hypothetical protein A2600_08035 [Candidatus Lambdaproteobacteria bacterium RIFOXYD1_FULL_56_27]|uniref:Flippase-like domain-containing protein n=1 Tax=Candidatus Lambdaproteobacteria bacterium RIFOXYD2_FULL_56_26 TaxID=1817773 RepID=A0A1F6GUP2_9PROT|nr:MAG: hypothetical protein A2426_11845 [Candidatus Lambdaproteobacteria bacterium RIFOXYC1_FULL_56_13]OGH01818.1 MAG: hypothetical protein A2557_01885 [Candidatus Lambdaproteobacteria bacterium RIFOXYD2_FULL_56_26]OGH07530.1 MAG: hypothetical protein A2600_08035 [Candidatus Lambdaproteobacteria bacterium RIFOXYD1_FULL_56_27]
MRTFPFKKALWFLLKLAFLVGIFWYLLHSEMLHLELLLRLAQKPAAVLGQLVLLFGLLYFPVFLRLKVLLEAADYRMSFGSAVWIGWISLFFSTFLPGTVTADAIKIYLVLRENPGRSIAPMLAVMTVDHVFALVIAILISAVAVASNLDFFGQDPTLTLLAQAVVLLFVGLAVVWILLSIPFKKQDPVLWILGKLPATGGLSSVYLTFRQLAKNRRAMAKSLLLSSVSSLGLLCSYGLLIEFIGLSQPHTGTLLWVISLADLSTAVPIGPSGLGVGHVTFEYFFQLAGLQGGADTFNLHTILRLIVCFFGAVPYLLYRRSAGLAGELPALSPTQTDSQLP